MPKSLAAYHRYTLNGIVSLLLLTFGVGCTLIQPPLSDNMKVALKEAYQNNDYFTLREHLDSCSTWLRTPEINLYRATEATYFNRPEEAQRFIQRFLTTAKTQPDSSVTVVWQLALTNQLRLGNYRAAANAADTLTNLLEKQHNHEAANDYREQSRLWHGLETVGAMTCTKDATSRVSLKRDKAGRPSLPIAVGKFAADFMLDMRVGFSFVSATQAKRMGIHTLPLTTMAASVRGEAVEGALAVVPELSVGVARIKNAIFLVMPDKAFVYPDGTTAAGIIGFPVLSAMQEVAFTRDEYLLIPREATTTKGKPNFYLDAMTPVTLAICEGAPLAFRLDMENSLSALYAPFYNRYREKIEHNYSLDSVRVGKQIVKTFLVKEINFGIGNAIAKVDSIHVFTQTPRGLMADYYGSLGRDVIGQFEEMRINFSTMQISFKK